MYIGEEFGGAVLTPSQRALEILEGYRYRFTQGKEKSPHPWNGCENRVISMRKSFQRRGLKGSSILYIRSDYWVTLVNSYLFDFHYALMWDNRVYDPTTRTVEPLTLERFLQANIEEAKHPSYWNLRVYQLPDLTRPIWGRD